MKSPVPTSFVDAKGVADFSPGLSRIGDTLGQVWNVTADPNGVTDIFRDPVGVGISVMRKPRGSPRSSAQPWAKINDPVGVERQRTMDFVDAKGVADFSPGLSRIGDTLGQTCDLTSDPNGVTEDSRRFRDPVGVGISVMRKPRVAPRSSAQPWAKIRDSFGVQSSTLD